MYINFASKLVALTDRRTMAMRDIYDVWFFAQHQWDIDAEVVRARTGVSLREHIDACVARIEGVKDTQILHGVAELLADERAKVWVKTSLRREAVFLLRQYASVLG